MDMPLLAASAATYLFGAWITALRWQIRHWRDQNIIYKRLPGAAKRKGFLWV